jgi:hypothetical protein
MSTSKTRPAPWSDYENRALVALYFTMLDYATAGGHYNKAAMIREAQNGPAYRNNHRNLTSEPSGSGALGARSRGSVELKLMNASAAHRDVDADAVTMDGYGYRALPNYQATLKDAMRLKIDTRRRCYIGSDGVRHAG